jgi:hypothetical protein
VVSIVPTGLYTRPGEPWWSGIAGLFAVLLAGFYLAPDALLILVGIGLPLAGGAVFGYRGRSFWWAVVAAVAAWLVFAVISTLEDGWDIGPAEDVIAAVFFALFLAGATMLGGVLGKHLASRPRSR